MLALLLSISADEIEIQDNDRSRKRRITRGRNTGDTAINKPDLTPTSGGPETQFIRFEANKVRRRCVGGAFQVRLRYLSVSGVFRPE